MKKNDIEKRSEEIMELCMDIQQEVRCWMDIQSLQRMEYDNR